jgi:hypothetical protein
MAIAAPRRRHEGRGSGSASAAQLIAGFAALHRSGRLAGGVHRGERGTVPATKKPASRAGKTARKRTAASEPAAIKRLNKSLEAAQDALAALRKDVSKDVSVGSRDLYKDVQKFVKDARRDSGRLSKALQRDIERMQKRLSASPRAKSSSRAGAPRKTAARSTTKRTASRTRAK